MTTKNGECADEAVYAFADSIEKLAGILTGVAEGLENLAKTFEASDDELVGLNAGKTDEEIRKEDELAALIAAPLVNALDSVTAILNGATEQVMKMVCKQSNDGKQAEGA